MEKIAHIEVVVTPEDRRWADPYACTVRVRAGGGPRTREGEILGQRTERGNRAADDRVRWAAEVAARAGYVLEDDESAHERYLRDQRPGA